LAKLSIIQLRLLEYTIVGTKYFGSGFSPGNKRCLFGSEETIFNPPEQSSGDVEQGWN
jgi:hypothetical protein